MSDHAEHSGPGHIVSPMILVGTLVALLVLTFITVAVTWVNLGEFNLWIAMIIATIKAALVVLFFMHLYWDKPIIGIVFVTSLLLVALFIGLSMTDVDQVAPQRIPDYAPAVQQTTGS
ncbi:MAG: cytochrome C oxidase subunit IV family protein [Candidatus Eisenbacteria bacterium]